MVAFDLWDNLGRRVTPMLAVYATATVVVTVAAGTRILILDTILAVTNTYSTVPVLLKRYGVLHPYPLPSLWRSSPGQIRNFPVDATAS